MRSNIICLLISILLVYYSSFNVSFKVNSYQKWLPKTNFLGKLIKDKYYKRVRLVPLYNVNGMKDFDGKSFHPENEIDKKQALDLLESLVSSDFSKDPSYDIEKESKKKSILAGVSYHDLKELLRFHGLDEVGDKMQMLVRYLLFIIDPSLKMQLEE